MHNEDNPFKCALNPYRPGGEIAKRLDKIAATALELGYSYEQYHRWTQADYFALCDLAGVARPE